MRVLPDDGKVIVDGVNVAKKHQKPTKPTMQGGIIDKDMPIDVSQRRHRRARRAASRPASATASSDGTQGPHLPAKCGEVTWHERHRHRPSDVPRLKQRYNDEVRAQLQGASSASPTSCRCRASRRSSSTWASAGPPSSRRCSRAPSPTSRMITGQKPIVTKAKKSIAGFKLREGNVDRRQGHPARRPHVGVPRPAHQPRHPPHPRLPRPAGQLVRRPRQLHVRRHRAADLPGDRLRQGRLDPGHGHHHRHHRPHRRRGQGPARCLRLPVQA